MYADLEEEYPRKIHLMDRGCSLDEAYGRNHGKHRQPNGFSFVYVGEVLYNWSYGDLKARIFVGRRLIRWTAVWNAWDQKVSGKFA